jgi:hypothetical protein
LPGVTTTFAGQKTFFDQEQRRVVCSWIAMRDPKPNVGRRHNSRKFFRG